MTDFRSRVVDKLQDVALRRPDRKPEPGCAHQLRLSGRFLVVVVVVIVVVVLLLFDLLLHLLLHLDDVPVDVPILGRDFQRLRQVGYGRLEISGLAVGPGTSMQGLEAVGPELKNLQDHSFKYC